jgi:HlyD family secretion protein
MTRIPPILALAAVACLTLACSKDKPPVWQGYVEGEFVYVASQLAGRLDELAVNRGDVVLPGDRLFVLEHEFETQGVGRTSAAVTQLQSTVNDLKKGLRPEEIEQILAKLDQAQAQLSLNRLEMQRRERLLSQGAVAQEEYDQARTSFLNSQGALADLRAQLATGKLGSRIDQILAAQDQVRGAQAELAQAQWSLDQKIQSSTVEGLVFDLLHYRGEWVAAGSPVVKLLPPENIKVRFFVPETQLGAVSVGQAVRVACDGCPAPFQGRVSFVFPQAEYTPPVIYSQDFRAKLVFMIEARFPSDQARRLKPGQPVDVSLEAGL